VRVTYTGPLVFTYPDYVDTATGRSLVAEPGGTYDIQAVRHNAPDMPVGDFRAADDVPEDEEDESLTPEPIEE